MSNNQLMPYWVDAVTYQLTLQHLPDSLTDLINFQKVPNRIPQQPGIFFMHGLKERTIKLKRTKTTRRFDKRSFRNG